MVLLLVVVGTGSTTGMHASASVVNYHMIASGATRISIQVVNSPLVVIARPLSSSESLLMNLGTVTFVLLAPSLERFFSVWPTVMVLA